VWSGGEWLEYDLAGETAAVKAERLWSEAALQAQRRNNARSFSCQAMCFAATCKCLSSMPLLLSDSCYWVTDAFLPYHILLSPAVQV